MSRLAYIVVRYELGDTGIENYPQVLQSFNERVFLSEKAAKQYANSLDPSGDGFEYTCPCGCGDVHWRSWEIEPILLEE